MNLKHLTDEQFSELLAGETASNDALSHLSACPACDRELACLRSAVSDLRGFSQRWAEERAPRIVSPSRWTLGRHTLPAWSAAATVLLCGFAMGVHFQAVTRPSPVAISQSQTVATAPSDDELSEDNQLLRSINQELSRQVRPQVPASELTVSSKDLSHALLREVSN
jgi:anti-sigma factor RsiW